MLADELGLEPGEELRRLEAAILVHDRSLQPSARPRPTGEVGVAALLLDRDPTLAVARGKVTALHVAARAGYPDFAALLLERGPGLLHATDNDGLTPLHWAA